MKKWWVIGAALACVLIGLIGLWVSGVFTVKMKDGTLVLKKVPADAQVLIDGHTAMVTMGDGNVAEIRLTPGKKHRLEVKKPGFKVFRDEVEIESGGRHSIKVTFVPLPDPKKKQKVPRIGPDRPAYAGRARFPIPKDIDRPIYGEWEIKNNELVQPRWIWGARLLFGDKTWTDYDFTVEAQMTDRNCGFGLIFRNPGGELQVNKQDGTDRHKDYMLFVVGAYANTHHELDQVVNAECQTLGKTALEPAQRLQQGEWYTARVSVRANRVRSYLNGAKLFDVFAKPPPAGLVGLMTWDAPFHFRNIKVTDPAGKVLLQGLPDLDK